MLFGIPVALAAAVGALRTAGDKPFAVAALVIAALEALTLVAMFVVPLG